jgi:hypothetical protein
VPAVRNWDCSFPRVSPTIRRNRAGWQSARAGAVVASESMPTDGSTSGGFAAVLGALKDFRVGAQLSLGAAVTSAVLLWAPKWLPALTTPDSWRPWLVVAFVGGIAVFLVGQVTDFLLDQLGAHRARRDSKQAVKAAAELAAQQRRDAELSSQRNLREIAESQTASVRAIELERRKFVESMTLAEIGICRSFVVPGNRSQSLPLDPNVRALARRDVLHLMAGGETVDGIGTPYAHYTMSDWAWSYFKEHPEALEPTAKGLRQRPDSTAAS